VPRSRPRVQPSAMPYRPTASTLTNRHTALTKISWLHHLLWSGKRAVPILVLIKSQSKALMDNWHSRGKSRPPPVQRRNVQHSCSHIPRLHIRRNSQVVHIPEPTLMNIRFWLCFLRSLRHFLIHEFLRGSESALPTTLLVDVTVPVVCFGCRCPLT
jgi:hypothetical protein